MREELGDENSTIYSVEMLAEDAVPMLHPTCCLCGGHNQGCTFTLRNFV